MMYEGIKLVQFIKKTAHHSEIDRSTYEALFRCKANVVGLITYLLVERLCQELQVMKDLLYN